MPERYAKITGWGKYVPERVLTNADLEKMVDTSDEWITTRTGIKERRIRNENEQASDFSVKSALPALKMAGITAKDLDLIIVACSSPDYLVPGVATIVQHKLGAQCGAFQLASGCSGWVYALVTASQFIQAGTMNNILVIGTDLVSYGVDYTDRTTCVLFGDASAAVVLQPSEEPAGVITYELGSDGSGAEHLYVPGAGSVMPIGKYGERLVNERLGYLKMNGPEVFKFATRTLASSMKRVMDKAGLLPEDIALFIPHQANLRIIESAARMMRQPLDKFMINLHKYGNTSAASVPLALVEAIEEGKCKIGDKIVMCAFGAGLTWASAVVLLGSGEVSLAHSWLSLGRIARRTVGKARDVVQNFLLSVQLRRYDAKRKAKTR
ncbi:MAG: 3-oxoacyl-ACP synthase [Candidatus Thermofonsia Clade 1 bacterium]|jgi:3-oxoacyl-[acyl-carrier-protein] synthase-3|uniref:Beta-ketoacyl-[acyl-carrier-protein] synthase III n=1 Tax=Candidatus Thermofonsia Clade 1 bacterium TaxID=2364210 RepID=A0A2M8P052_9CHLR|nr:MAG: 3-oxoacyl-ACP synthase [Candidatus Thermofonsia Clade 1 bacterium]